MLSHTQLQNSISYQNFLHSLGFTCAGCHWRRHLKEWAGWREPHSCDCICPSLRCESSTGALLPLLIVGDCCAVWLIGREVDWRYVVRLLPPAFVGVVIGWSLLGRLEATFKPLISSIIIVVVVNFSECGNQTYSQQFPIQSHLRGPWASSAESQRC